MDLRRAPVLTRHRVRHRSPLSSIPVSSGIVDYEEFYELTPNSYQHFLTDLAAAVAFAEECRQHQHDDLLIQKPGWNRGTPSDAVVPESDRAYLESAVRLHSCQAPQPLGSEIHQFGAGK